MRLLPNFRLVLALALLVGVYSADGQLDHCRCSARDEARTALHCSGDDALAKLTECGKMLLPEDAVHAAIIYNATFEARPSFHALPCFSVLQLSDWSFASRLEHLAVLECRFKKLQLEGATNLTSLSLASNELRLVDSAWLHPLKSLRCLDLSGNRLNRLPDNLTRHLTHLNLSRNEFLGLDAGWFGPSPFLVHLNLSHNRLESLGPGNISVLWDSYLPALQVLDLSWNKLTSLCGSCFAAQPRLSKLWLEHNRLEALPSEAFVRNSQLVAVYLAGCGRSLPTHSMTGTARRCTSLRRPVLCRQVEGTRGLRSLMSLNLGWNQLSSLPPHVLKLLGERSNDSLRLGHNPWLCDCNTVNFAVWLQHNKARSLHPHAPSNGGVRDIEDIRCSDLSSSRLAGQAIYTLLKSDLCPQPTNWTNGLLDAVNGIMAFLILAILTKLLRDYWRQKRSGKLPKFFGFV
ncbi:toll, putative [Ixodes scapularis]|uniref:Toll, putative n=1 Tax=Ixodes scapularis TaxID=6945 RepID=B7Q3N9_IXOSC|nr:toll, putative [Ixodes scapularis]|eukprot:XP_002411337.1 toll, putative [Ixodes scapularis]